MSLEERLAEMTEALNANTVELKRSNEGRAKLLEKGEKLASAKEDTAGKTEKAATTKAASSKSKKDSGEVSDTAIRKAFGDFMQVDDKNEREGRKAIVVEVLEEFDAETSVDLKPKDRQAAIDLLQEKLEEAESKAKKGKAKKSRDEDDEDEEEDRPRKKRSRDEEDEDEEEDRPRKKKRRDEDDE